MVVKSEALLNLAQLRINLQKLMKPEILAKLAEFLEKTAYEDSSMLERYKWFVENGENGADCKYASMAREFFLKDQAENAAKAIIWLYHNWARNYE
jgi:hypothetical protein